MTGIGIIGLGVMGRGQAKSFLDAGGCRVVAGADPSGESRAEFAKIAPDAAVYASHEELLADARVDAVVIAVPTLYHEAVTLDALRAARHILLEKPMARTVAACRRIIDAADRAQRLVMVAHCRRFDADWGVFADAIRSGKVGRPVLWRFVRGGVIYGKWFMDDAVGGGPLFDGAVHNYDFGNWLFGMPESVTGTSIKFDPNCTAVDTGNAILRYRDGSQHVISWSWAVPGSPAHDCMGDKATFVFGDGGLPVPPHQRAHHLLDRQNTKMILPFTPNDMYVDQAKHFLACLDGATCISPATDAIQAVAVGEAVLRACRENTTVRIDPV